MNIQKEFELLLEEGGKQKDFQCKRYISPIRNTHNIVELSGQIDCLIYIHIRSEEPYRWGVTKTRVEELAKLQKKWFVVLLFETPEEGYLLTANDVRRYINENLWPLGKNEKNKNEYKVQPGKSLKYHKPFKTFQEFMNSLEQKMDDNFKTIIR
jgi:hypothetical protein